MTATAPKLATVPASPEARLRASFKREDELMRELTRVLAEQRAARNDYAEQHGLLVRPGLAALRKVLGG